MLPLKNRPAFFVSYARGDAEYDSDRERVYRFISDLAAKVAGEMGRPNDEVCFVDKSSIEVGTEWPSELSDALSTIPIAVALYSPRYFASEWCGKEFHAFLKRLPERRPPGNPLGIVPVLWKRVVVPPVVQHIQYEDKKFPPEYKQVGLEKIMSLKVLGDQYELALGAVADIIVSAHATGLIPIDTLNLDGLPSAWTVSAGLNPDSHKEGSIGKTCFVFVSREGWDWEPYPEVKKKIGALAQQISGDLNLRCEWIDCDDELAKKLQETRGSRVPTIIYGDPRTITQGVYAQRMREYDNLYLLNCGALVPWSEDSRTKGDTDETWLALRNSVCRQKTKVPPPNHEWRSIFSILELETKTRTVIEDIRLKLLEEILSEEKSNATATNAGYTVRRAEDEHLAESAAVQGIRLESAPQLEGPTR